MLIIIITIQKLKLLNIMGQIEWSAC